MLDSPLHPQKATITSLLFNIFNLFFIFLFLNYLLSNKHFTFFSLDTKLYMVFVHISIWKA
jgi:hypothetical protein